MHRRAAGHEKGCKATASLFYLEIAQECRIFRGKTRLAGRTAMALCSTFAQPGQMRNLG